MGQVTTEQIMEQEPQKKEEREAEKPKEEIESIAQNEESEKNAHTSGKRIEETNLPPIQGEIKLEIAQRRTSKQNKRKPNWLGQNVIVTKIEAIGYQAKMKKVYPVFMK